MCTEKLWPLARRFVHIRLTLKCQALTQSSSGDDKSQREQCVHSSHPSQTSLCRQGLNTHLRVSSHLANTDLTNPRANHKNWLPLWQKNPVLLMPKSLPCTHEDEYFMFTSSVPAVENNLNTLRTAVQEHAQVCTHLSLSHKEIKKRYLSCAENV